MTIAKTALAAAAAILAPAAAQAVTYDAFTSFNATNGAGHFFYSQTPVAGGAGSPLTPGGSSCVISNTICLQTSTGLPGIYKSTAGAFPFGSVNMPGDRLLFHPGPAQNVLVTFVAPTSGLYNVSLALSVQDNSPSGVNVFSFNNEGGTVSGGPLTSLGTGNMAQSFGRSIFLNAGQYIGLGINPGASYNNDSIGVNFTISDGVLGVPEPATWAMFLGGFGILGSAMRRRRVHTSAAVYA